MLHIKQRILSIITFSVASALVSATTYYVSPTGLSTASGAVSSPLNFSAANAKALSGGDSLILRGGTYSFSSAQTFSKSGSSTKYIHVVAFPGEIPIFDFRTQAYSSGNQGVKVSGNYIHILGLIVQGAGDNGMQVTGSNNIVEYCTFRWNCDSGLQMKTGSANLILNCDSYENFDYETGGTANPDYGGNADGFADKQYTNTGINIYKGCRSWANSDDGWDSYEKNGNTEYDSCWCYANGPASYDMTEHIRFKTDSAAWFSKFKNTAGRYVITNYGNGNGLKLGGNYTANNTLLRNCISVGNKVKGFDQNNNNGTMTIYNCSAYNNQYNYGFSNSSYGTLNIKNCASLNSTKSNTFNCKSVTQANNSWNSGFSCVTSDFVSLDYNQMKDDRNMDGSLPEISFLHQASTSGMIDKGIDLGLAFSGSAPDLGAFEYNLYTANTERMFDNHISVYYSTSQKSILLKGDIYTVEIYNIVGGKVFSGNVSSDYISIPAAHFAKGMYLVVANSTHFVRSSVKILVP